MSLIRISVELSYASQTFPNVEADSSFSSVKAALQTSAGRTYIALLNLTNYPNRMPYIYITAPALLRNSPHRWPDDLRICYLHPNKWNPGLHNLTFALGRTAKWLNKYDVWLQTGRWPGAEYPHSVPAR